MPQRSYRGLLIALALLGVAVDQVSKYGVFRWLYEHPRHYDADRLAGTYEVVPGAFRLLVQYTPAADPQASVLRTWSAPKLPRVNHGALFGLGNERTNWANNFFSVVSVLAAVAIAFWAARRHTARDRLLCAALGLILAGTLGNLYDRVVFGGVRDFLYFYWIEWPVFNVADCCLVCGAFLLLAQAFFAHPTPADPPKEPALAVPEPVAK